MDTWLAIVKRVINFGVPYNTENFLTSYGTVSFSRRALLSGVTYLVALMTNLQDMTDFLTSESRDKLIADILFIIIIIITSRVFSD